MKTTFSFTALLAFAIAWFALVASCGLQAHAAVYDVGPGQPLASISDAPWATLQPGDTVLIHGRAEPYREKWVICRRGTPEAWITVRGVPGPSGALPVIEGNGAATPASLNTWNETRSVIKIGGANSPPDTLPAYIAIENLEIRGGRPPYGFTGRNGAAKYDKNTAAIFIEKGEHLAVRGCALHDCGNGFMCASATSDLLVERCHIYDNGNEGSIYEHNNYTEARGIVFQFNHFGPLRAGCPGNNLKDRSAGLVVRYNWIEAGNRQLDLVDSHALAALPEYRKALVYGNILVEPPGAGNRQIVHYGGDSGKTDQYRKGTLHFYNNTVVSTRTDRTTLVRLSSADETCDARNNIVWTRAPGSTLALLEESGTLNLASNWLKVGWVKSFAKANGTVNDRGGNITGDAPGFVNEAGEDFRLGAGSPCIDRGAALAEGDLPLDFQYVRHQRSAPRAVAGKIALGAYEAGH